MKYCFALLLFSFCCHAQKLEISKLTENFYLFTTYKKFNGNPVSGQRHVYRDR
jgi:hypothetical protein